MRVDSSDRSVVTTGMEMMHRATDLTMPIPRRAALLATLLLCACGGGGGDRPPDPGRAKYDADKAHCESISDVEAAQKSCMTYRGWPDGKYRR